GDGLPGDVVVGGPEAAAHEDGVGSGEGGPQPVHDAGVVVAHLGLEQAVDAVGGQLLADPGRVRVHDLAEQELGADGQDVATHTHGAAMMPGAGPRPPVRRAAKRYWAPVTTVRTVATQRNELYVQATPAVSGSRASPTANCWQTVLALANCLAGTLTPWRPATVR